ncbi:MAG TPA: pectate lyase [bacterium]|nr:pectate lyase [bacterium]HPM60438.1 pectate lyase [bacterium]
MTRFAYLAGVGLLLALTLLPGLSPAIAAGGEGFEEAIQPPVIPERSLSIRDFGAISDGHTLCTEAIQRTITTCAGAGGGRVIIPSGIWLTGPIRLESRIELHLESGALLLFSSDHSLYPIIQAPTKGWLVASPIYGYKLEDVAVTGRGIIDGAGESWRPVKKFKTTSRQWKELVDSGGIVSEKGDMWWPSREALEGEAWLEKLQKSKPKKEHTAEDYLPARDYLRPYMLSFIDCKRVFFEGVTIRNSPKFALCPAWCDQLIIRDVKVNNEWWAQNGDGIDISACRNVLVENCTVTAGDDGICMKSSDRSGRTGPALENVLIRNCIVYHGHGGFVVGSNTDGGMRNICVENCTFIGTDAGLRFKSARGRGGVVENIRIRNIRMKDITGEAISFDAFYESSQPDTLARAVTPETPVFRNITIDSLYCAGAARAIVMTGLPEMPVQNIRIRDAHISATAGVQLRDVRDLALEQVVVKPARGALYDFKRCSGISIDGAGFMDKSADFPSDSWRSLMHHDNAWFATPEAAAVAENLLLYQCAIGGWPKNIDMARPLSPAERAALASPPADTLATIDNGATWTQLAFLARLISVHPEPRFIAAFNRGLDYLFAAQYDNGGWPQFYPLHPGYYSHITYNDDAMIGVLTLLHGIAANEERFRFVDAARRARAASAVERGIGCILATQLKEGERWTAWCAQYDEKSLQPAPARRYELVSLSGDESVGIVRFLMRLRDPAPEIVDAVQGAVDWLEKVKIIGTRVDYVTDASLPGGFNKVVVSDPAAPPIWARFYLIGSNRPFFSDRDGRIYYDLAEISAERRNDYAWLGYWPQELLAKEYPAWLARADVRLKLSGVK